MRVAVQGCGHGELRRIYSAVATAGGAHALLVCGDFQAVRDARDLATLDVPARYRRPGDFGAYYRGAARAPVPTLYVGGNHEAAEHAWALYHGGWAAPNVFYVGHAGAYLVGGLTIAGISGIGLDLPGAVLGYDCRNGDGALCDSADNHFCSNRDHAIVNGTNCKSIETRGGIGHGERVGTGHALKARPYHTRAWEAARMHTYAAVLRSGAFGARRVDVFLSHEWPRGAAEAGDLPALLKRKPFFAGDLAPGGRGLGSQGLRALVDDVRPRRWFAAHMHVSHDAVFEHASGERTRFLALDKCISGREHLRVVDIGAVDGCDTTAFDGCTDHSKRATKRTKQHTKIIVDGSNDHTNSTVDGSNDHTNSTVDGSNDHINGTVNGSNDHRKGNFGEINTDSIGNVTVEYDPAWLAVVRAYDAFMNTRATPTRMPTAAELDIGTHVAAVQAMVAQGVIPRAVPMPAAPYTRDTARQQSSAFCAMLGLADRWASPGPCGHQSARQ